MEEAEDLDESRIKCRNGGLVFLPMVFMTRNGTLQRVIIYFLKW
jgi:hypothetical protein